MTTANPYQLLDDCLKASRCGQANRNFVFGVVLHFLFRGTKAAETVELLETVLHENTPGFAELNAWARGSGHILNVVKPACYALFAAGARPAQDRQYGWSQYVFPLTRRDRAVIRAALVYAPLRATLRGFLREGCAVLSLSELHSSVAATLTSSSYTQYVRKFVGRKMRFFTQNGDETPSDVVSDASSTALYALLRAYPYWTSPGHMIAIAKVAAHNRGHNIIKAHASQKRVALIRNDDGSYSARGTSINASEAAARHVESHASMVADITGSRQRVFDLDTLASLASLLDGPASRSLRPKQIAYLRLLTGRPDATFSEYLGMRNDEAAHTMSFETYHRNVCRFLDVGVSVAHQFLKQLAHTHF